MSKFTVATIVLSLLLVMVFTQCPVQCTCSSNSSNTCNSNACVHNFYNDTSSNSCLVNSTIYTLPLSTDDGSLPLAPTATCGPLFTSPIPGNYSSNVEVDIYIDPALDSHYSYRVVASVLFVGKWSTANTLTLYVDNSIILINKYNVSAGANFSIVQTCGDNYNGNNQSVYLKFDTGDISHSATSINVSMVPSKCNGCDGNTTTCHCGWFMPQIMVLFRYCDPSCLVCQDIVNTNCSQCSVGYFLSGSTCDIVCQTGYFTNPNGSNICIKCDSACQQCVGPATNCTICNAGFIFYPSNNSCLASCPDGTYNDSTYNPNQCSNCIQNCSKCTNNPTPCQACNTTWYLYNSDCITTCPADLFTDNNTNTCQNCTTYCINLTMSLYTTTGLNGISPITISMTFTAAMDWNTFPYQTFQTISFEDAMLSLDVFNVSYTLVNTTTYTINLVPKGYSFLVNESITVTTQAFPGSDLYSSALHPLSNQTYSMSLSTSYTYIEPPTMTQTESQIVGMFSNMSSQFNNFTTLPGVQEIKKFGFFLLALNSLSITSCLVLINSILPQNFYEGTRMFASLIFFDVPPWQADSDQQKLFFVPPVESFTRRRLSTQMNEFRFRRTGFSGVFILDTYSQIILIAVGYISLGLSILLVKKCKWGIRIRGYLQTCLSCFHEICVMYFTLSIVFEFIYFDSTKPIRIISMTICMIVTLYYLVYQSWRYHDLMRYPKVVLDTPEYDYFLMRYGHMLKNIRFLEYKNEQNCYGWRNWFRPYNYHIVGYIKKFAMMMAFVCFYYESFAQPIALIVIQLSEITRFCLTWPYAKKWRNICRLILEVMLLAIFALIYFMQLIVYNLMRGTNQVWATWFFLFGWIALGVLILYNVGFIVLAFINLWQMCKFTNRELMDENRRDYYFEKLNDYEQNHENVPIEMINEFVKKGNLNKRNLQKLPNITFRIEYYKIEKEPAGFAVEVKAIFQLFMEMEFNYKSDSNNIAPGRSFEKVVHVDINSPIHDILEEIHHKYAAYSSNSVIVLKTFIDVEQSKYASGQQIPLQPKHMHQQVTVFTENPNDQPKATVLKTVLDGFPVAPYILNNLS